MAALRSLPVNEAAAVVVVRSAARPEPAAVTDEVPGIQTVSACAQPADPKEKQSSAGGKPIIPKGGASTGQPPPEPAWMDLHGSRMLAPAGVPAMALPQGFVAAESASAEQVLTELLGVRRVSEAETYRCGRHFSASHCACDV